MASTLGRMGRLRRVLGACLVGALPLAQALDRGTTSAGVAYVSGGVGAEEQLEMAQEQSRHGFWLTTAARGSGAYLADVQVRIVVAGTRRVVLERTMAGPWLFVALPPGRYDVVARFRDRAGGAEQALSKSTTIRAGERRQMILYFTATDEWVGGNGPRSPGEPQPLR